MQIKEVKVKFEENGKEYSFDCSNVYVNLGDFVVVDTVRGHEIGMICSKVTFKEYHEDCNLKKVLRIATKEDIKQKEENKQKEEEIKTESQQISDSLKLDMKVIKVEE